MHRAYLGAQSDLNGIGQLVHASQHLVAALNAEANILGGIEAHCLQQCSLESKVQRWCQRHRGVPQRTLVGDHRQDHRVGEAPSVSVTSSLHVIGNELSCSRSVMFGRLTFCLLRWAEPSRA